MRAVRVDYDSWTKRGDVQAGTLEGAELTTERIDEVIRAMDGDRHTEVLLTIGEEVPHMIIGGGPELFVVTATFDYETFHLATTPNASGEVDVVAGGQRGRFDRADTVGREQALEAARVFALDGVLSPKLMWREA